MTVECATPGGTFRPKCCACSHSAPKVFLSKRNLSPYIGEILHEVGRFHPPGPASIYTSYS